VSVIHPNSEQYPDRQARCFLCGDSFADRQPVAFWGGANGNLYLHGGCAGSFVLRLARDAWEIERDAADGKFAIVLREEGWRGPRKG
jgi:hypothetical protein